MGSSAIAAETFKVFSLVVSVGAEDVVSCTLLGVATEAVSTDHEGGYTFQFGGGGELSCFQFANAGFQTVNTALEDGEFLFKLFHQALELVGHFGDAVETGVQQSSRFKAGHRPVAAVGAVGVTGNTAVALDQVAKCLISPVGWVNVRKLSDAGDLLASSGVVRHTVDIQLSGISSHRSQKAQGCWGHQQLMEKFHFGLTPEIEVLKRKASPC